ncbi:ABC transporter ATP-binding protein [Oleisolibacter albus]|uniref:ABC transporter ATP-binding protein n=1 Tax=Oleisolibacter albus TaxID=2171757 RepID=UPI000DF31F62|nr:ABC transporter ATP-binding protein [Oleisolibacter albus]
MSTAPTVEARAVCKRYGRHEAVRGVDLTLHPGECVALVGHNGAGKSSLIKLMLGLTHPTGGSLHVLGQDPAGPQAARIRRQVGFLPENVAFHPGMTGLECLDFYARLKGLPTAGNRDLLERVGLGREAAGKRIGTYSKGMRQRLGLSQALLGAPRLLFLDEPTTGLDPALRQSFYAIVRELRDGGATVLLCSHALTELEGQADRVVVMNRGRKVAEGCLATLRQLADLPVRLRVRPVDGTQAGTLCALYGIPAQDGPVVALSCSGADKLPLLRHLLESGIPLEDLEVVQPSLDDIYAHFLAREDAA